MRPKIVIAANCAPIYAGGLGAYQRKLGELLKETTGHEGLFLCRELSHSSLPATDSPLPWPLMQLPLTLLGRFSRSFWPRLASRPKLVPFLAKVLAYCWCWPRELRPQAIHFVGTGWDFTGYFLAAQAARWKVPFSIWPAVHPKEWGDDAIDIALYRRADFVFCQSDFERAYLMEKGVEESRLFRASLYPMCLPDGEGGRFRERFHLAERPCVLFLGRRTAGKGYACLVSAWKMVAKQLPEAVLVVGGPEWKGEEATVRLDELPADSYRDLGTPTASTLSDALSACDIFCLPSSGESFGIVYVEAWSFGKPVICGTAPASRELIENGVTGLWSSQDPGELAEKLLRLLGNPAECHAMGMAGQKLQQERYQASHYLKALMPALNCS